MVPSFSMCTWLIDSATSVRVQTWVEGMVMGQWCEVASVRVIVTGPVGAWRAAMGEDIGAARAVVERRARVTAARDLANMFERVVGWLVGWFCVLLV